MDDEPFFLLEKSSLDTLILISFYQSACYLLDIRLLHIHSCQFLQKPQRCHLTPSNLIKIHFDWPEKCDICILNTVWNRECKYLLKKHRWWDVLMTIYNYTAKTKKLSKTQNFTGTYFNRFFTFEPNSNFWKRFTTE